MRLRDWTAARRHRQDPESGQAMVEFALILFPLLILVVGIIQFGIGLNYWLDMQRIANQGARWAAVDNWPPDCTRAATSCPSPKHAAAALESPGDCCRPRRTTFVALSLPVEDDGYREHPGDPVRDRLTTSVRSSSSTS